MTIRQIGVDRSGYTVAGYVVSDRSMVGRHDSVDEILGDFDWLSANRSRIDALVMGIGNPAMRDQVADEAERRFPDIDWPSFIHPSAQLDMKSTRIEKGVVVCANAVVTVNVVVEAFVLIHYGCTVSHECRLGRAAVLNPASVISGGVTVGKAAMIGAGAVITQYRSIGAEAIVGAGAVVTRDVPPGTTVAGVPAQVLKEKQHSE